LVTAAPRPGDRQGAPRDGLLLAGLEVGGTVGLLAGLVAVAAALSMFGRAAFRVPEGRDKPAEPRPEGPR
jgi:hypothetical protein